MPINIGGIMKDKILEPRYVTPSKPQKERNYFFVALLLIVLFFGYSMWVLHREAPTIPIVRKWYYPPFISSQGNIGIGEGTIRVKTCDTLYVEDFDNLYIGKFVLDLPPHTTGTLNISVEGKYEEEVK